MFCSLFHLPFALLFPFRDFYSMGVKLNLESLGNLDLANLRFCTLFVGGGDSSGRPIRGAHTEWPALLGRIILCLSSIEKNYPVLLEYDLN